MAIAACLFALCTLEAAPLKNAKRITAGGPDGFAKMSFKGIYGGKPIGYAYITGGEYPDFIQDCAHGMPSDRGLWLCIPDGVRPDGQPVYKQKCRVDTPWDAKKYPSRLRLYQDGEDIYLICLTPTKITVTKWDGVAFVPYCENAVGKIENLSSFDVIRRDNRGYDLVLLCTDGTEYRPEDTPDPDGKITVSYYDGAGVYRGELPRGGLRRMWLDNDWKPAGGIENVTPDMRSVQGATKVACVRGADGTFDGYVIAGNLGALKFVPFQKKFPRGGVVPRTLRDPDGNVFLHRAYSNQLISFPSAPGDRTSLLVGGECALHLYPHQEGSEPVYGVPSYVWERHAPIYGGSLTVPNVFDWDGDGAQDIIAGNSEGRLLFFKNLGTDAEPDFRDSEEMESDGKPIRFLPGYNIVQGPFEGGWGYLCPTVFDWNGDGLPDIVFSGSRAKYEVMLNIGTRTEPRLAAPVTIRYDGMELHGTWRVRPALYTENGETYMMIMDDDNALHLYRRLDNTNVEDAGKVLMTNGKQITGHNNAGERLGQMGRGKLRLYDWDGDGDLDLFVGSVKRASFPSPEDGLPYRRFIKKETGMQVMYFENVGGMRFKAPRQLQVDGKDFYLGAHSNAPEPCMLGDTSAGPNLIVGCESGKYWFFEHSHINYVE